MASLGDQGLLVAGGWLPRARHCRSPNCNPRPPGTQVSLLVIHNISLPPGVFGGGHIDNFFCNRLDDQAHPYFAHLRGVEVSAHFLIRRSGELVQYVSVDERAWHAGTSIFCGQENCNDFSIGVELEGTDVRPFTKKQYRRLIALSALLMRIFPGITLARIVGHSDIAPGRKTDPGPAFNWMQFRTALAGVLKVVD